MFYLPNHQQSGRDKGQRDDGRMIVITKINRCCDERREYESASGLKGERDTGAVFAQSTKQHHTAAPNKKWLIIPPPMFAETLEKLSSSWSLVFQRAGRKNLSLIFQFTLTVFMTDWKDNGFSTTSTPMSFPEVKNPGKDPDWPCSAFRCWEEPCLQKYSFFPFK